MPAQGLAPLDYAVAGRGFPGAAESGDRFVVRPSARGILVAVIDGLGHGGEAAHAAAAAQRLLLASEDEPLALLINRCHAELRGTRGAAMTLAMLDIPLQTMRWIAIGNVEGMVLRAAPDGTREKFYVLPRGGIVGHRVPEARDTSLPLSPGDLLVLATDGIAAGFDAAVDWGSPPQRIADAILERHARASDDALVLVGRWSGAGRRS
jgi:phosphoserine phosphatase RsbX